MFYKKINFFKKSSALFLFTTLFLIAISVSAWTGPSENPPDGNVAEPINTSPQTQTKYGDINFTDWTDSTSGQTGYYVDPGGNSFLNRIYSHDIRGSIYYDLDDNNQTYYVNPASTSRLNAITPNSISLGGVSRTTWPSASKYIGDSGSHTAGGDLNMNGNDIKNVGQTGIGTNSPQYKFQLQDGGYYYSLGTTGSVSSGGLAGYALDTDPIATDYSSARIGIDSTRKLWIEAGRSSGGSGPQESLILQSEGGKVGVGTINPQYKFQVGDSNQGVIMDSNVDGHAGMGILSNNNPVGAIYFHPSFNSLFMKSYGGRNISFQTNNLERMTIKDNGNIGINTNNPSQKLDVNGNVMANSFIYSSDEKLKEDIETVSGLDIIKKLRGVNFKWKDSGEEGIGLIAQEVEKVLPELVHTDENKNLKSVEYANLVAPLIEAIKEQQKQIDELKRELEELKNNFAN